jgi:hypothetical protein
VATESEPKGRSLYLDTSAVLRAVLETATSPSVEQRIRAARVLVSSRLVDSCRAFLRLRALGGVSEERLVDAERDVAAIWSRCELWEITRSICETACAVPTARRTNDSRRPPPASVERGAAGFLS